MRAHQAYHRRRGRLGGDCAKSSPKGETSGSERVNYYLAMRVLREHFCADPATLGEDQFRDYILYVKTRKQWKPQTIRQTVACARIFFTEMLGRASPRERALASPNWRSLNPQRGSIP